ncbi:MAG: lipocalin-like domain-containing protein [Pseudomonadota bacterium]
MRRTLTICALLLGAVSASPEPLSAQDAPAGSRTGFAGLGAEASGFAQVRPDTPLRFPADHGEHPDYRIEWWYLTAVLEDDDGAPLGVQWTLFRQALSPPARPLAHSTPSGAVGATVGQPVNWAERQIWMAHAAVTTGETHRFAERLARGGVGQAGVRAAPFEAWLDDWAMRAEGGTGWERLALRAAGDDFSYALTLVADGPLVLQGERGYSVKSQRADCAAQASYYYSQPHFSVSGEVEIDGERRRVAGAAWLDREWSSQLLDPAQVGWDWFSLSFETGEKMMAFRLRRSDGAPDDLAGTWIDADGRATPFATGEVTLTPLGDPGRVGAPTRWRVEASSRGVDVETRALNPAAWNVGLIPYWEGPVFATGSHEGSGYLEMTGYTPPR